MEEKLYWIWASGIKGLGPRKLKRLLDYFIDAKGIWKADIEQITNVDSIGPVLGRRIINSKKYFNFKKEYKKIKKFGVRVVTLGDKCYPKLLKEIYDSPPVLYYKGDLSALNIKPTIAVVGSRKCTTYGELIAEKLSNRLASMGISIISGMARGIDTFAHQGALESGTTCAILGSGIDIVYPPENNNLMKEIINNGAVLTPFPMGTRPYGRNFPRRNRIISGLSLGTVVVEATKKSGSLITAEFALEQGREVFAIPGDITRKQSMGSNKLIKSGAKLVQNIDDILEEINFSSLLRTDIDLDSSNNDFKNKKSNNNLLDENIINKNNIIKKLTPEQKKVYQRLSYSPKQFEYLLNVINLNSAELNTVLLELELEELIEQLPGKRFRLAT
ncbi:DNA-processing protein DprA [Orenia marismortui]|uniref:DNA-processing protein DprA n=1 Tax=Orenia marismortui TaxID=46469 RepID=UPI00036CFA8A|nr:DNA-processing protein DprA [Orenia marismortui]